MSGMFAGRNKAPNFTEQSAPVAPKQVDETAGNAARAEMLRRRRAYGMEDTLLTADLGVAPTQKKTLLGE
jgi:hypothetical protein